MTSVRAYRNSQRKPNYWFHTLLFRRLLQYEQPADWFEYVEMCGWTLARLRPGPVIQSALQANWERAISLMPPL